MKMNDIRAMRNGAPFHPFQTYFSNGEVLPVIRLELMSMADDARELFVVGTEKSWSLVDASQVVRRSSFREHRA